jgi:PAS domain-containing protein
MFFSVPNIYRSQVLVMLFGTFIPWLAYILMIFGFYPYGLDPVPFFLAISSVLFFWALFRNRIFRINPIAFKTIFDNLSDGILIIDEYGEIIAQNKKAGMILEKTVNERDLSNIQQVFNNWPELSELFNSSLNKKSIEFLLENEGRQFTAL